jgi:hypothetical protein
MPGHPGAPIVVRIDERLTIAQKEIRRLEAARAALVTVPPARRRRRARDRITRRVLSELDTGLKSAS